MFAGIRFLARIAPPLGHIAKYKPDTTYTLADVLEERAAEFADHPFVLFEDRRVSYGEMNAQSNRIAHWAHGEVAEVLSGYPGIDMVNVYGVQVAGTDGRAGMVAFVLPDAKAGSSPGN